MNDENHKSILGKANKAKLSEATVDQFMNSQYIALKESYTVKGTIDTFRTHHISGAPVVDFENKILGVISEYDLLIQAASKPLFSRIEYKSQVISVQLETTLKEVLVILYKQKLKWMPVLNKSGHVQGVVSRIDVLSFIATNSNL